MVHRHGGAEVRDNTSARRPPIVPGPYRGAPRRALGWLVCATLALTSAPPTARADESGAIEGVVIDALTGAPIAAATISIAAAQRFTLLRTDAVGRYAMSGLPPGEYIVVVAAGDARAEHPGVVLARGERKLLVDRLDTSPEVITIRERAPASHEPTGRPVPARPTHDTLHHHYPYSDEAVLHDVWGVAWLLLDVDRTGRVERAKLLRRPGHGLDEIALREAWTLRFAPARDAKGRAVSTRLLWKMEWIAASRKLGFEKTLTDLAIDHAVPCAGRGPMNLDSLDLVYRDCSPPDLTRMDREPWVRAPGTTFRAARVDGDTDLIPALELHARDCRAGDAEGCTNLAMLCTAMPAASGVPARAAALCAKIVVGGARPDGQ